LGFLFAKGEKQTTLSAKVQLIKC